MRACTQHEVPLGRNRYHRIEQGCDSHGEPALVSHGVRPDGAGHPFLAGLLAGEGFLLHDALPHVQCCLPSEQFVLHPFKLHDALPHVQCCLPSEQFVLHPFQLHDALSRAVSRIKRAARASSDSIARARRAVSFLRSRKRRLDWGIVFISL